MQTPDVKTWMRRRGFFKRIDEYVYVDPTRKVTISHEAVESAEINPVARRLLVYAVNEQLA